jgi:hypothetical protein
MRKAKREGILMRHSESRPFPPRYGLTVNSSDHIEGEAVIAERDAHACDDGVLTNEEKKALDAVHKKQLHNRHRGVYQFRPYRTAIWMKEGIVRRFTPKSSNSKRERTWTASTPHIIPCLIMPLAATVKSETGK